MIKKKVLLPEKFVQNSIIEFLFRNGWGLNLRSKGTDEHGVDIKVRNNKFARYWLIECKGDASTKAKHPGSHREVCFNLALGQIITRMKRDGVSGYKYGYKYGVGFPETFQETLMRRLPYDVCNKLNLYAFFVNPSGKVTLIDWKDLRKVQLNKTSIT
jgi:hypothetical protein